MILVLCGTVFLSLSLLYMDVRESRKEAEVIRRNTYGQGSKTEEREVTVGGETKFACVDGPDFDGHKVDWDESLKRGKMYFDWERHKYEETCNLFSKEVQ